MDGNSNPFSASKINDEYIDALLVTVRFSASIPDLPLDVSAPESTTGAGLKQLIRAQLPPELSNHRLRLIYAGRGLEDAAALTTSLKLPPLVRTSRHTPDYNSDDDSSNTETSVLYKKTKDKGKQAVRDVRPRIYIHCSIGDIELSEADLALEAGIASIVLIEEQRQDEHKKPNPLRKASIHPTSQRTSGQAATTTSTTPAPRGFDRLLSAGFTSAEVIALRSQFLAVQSVSHTPDTMPTGEQLRDLEDRWMDEGSTVAQAQGGNDGAGANDDDGGLGSNSHSAIDDMLWGAVMGFFWPVGCAMWLRREEGIWSWRKGVAVVAGVIFNVLLGTTKTMG
ncbi:hypothetical protein N7495_003352 [Penicillium taxi]|uniref:uncharacterized protein n=1 Tax=Penicillium taxi TaxID=168475 RepID=UPI002545843F|nr:uncharacterized protein N7495_003352 [Penicillium taxi]KAJ5902824.1 hypothetical protein N7495_003352 [Penicillium taxi]